MERREIIKEIDDIAGMSIAVTKNGKFSIDWEATAKAIKMDLYELKRKLMEVDK